MRLLCLLSLVAPALLALGTTAAGAVLVDSDSSSGSSTATPNDTKESLDLESLSDAELEEICYKLGFRLHDEDELTGTKKEFTHADYVEAARQCLAVQDQMEEILEQNPELMAEYLAEVERMKAAELDERQRLLREIEQLEGEIAAASASSVTDTRSSDTPGGAAFGLSNPDALKIENANQHDLESPSMMSKNDTSPQDLVSEQSHQLTSNSIQKGNGTSGELLQDLIAKNDKADINDDGEELKALDVPPPQLQLPQAIQKVLDKYIPPPVQRMIGNLRIKVQEDVKQLLKLQIRLMKAIIGRVVTLIEERKAASALQQATPESQSI